MESVGVNMLAIEVTNRCNLNCPHCYYYEEGEKGTDYNDFVNLNAVDKLFNDMKIKYIWTLNFTGGEPLLAEDKIIEVLHKILKDGVLVLGIDIASNGTILSEKFAYELNEFSKKQYYFLKNHNEKFVREMIEFYDKNVPYPCTVCFRISGAWHDNDQKKTYEFYKEKMPNVFLKMDPNRTSKKNVIAYSGRSKNINSDSNIKFMCDSQHHKIKFSEDGMEVKCPLMMHYDGKISIAAYCSRCHWDKDVIGSVFDGKSLREMITEWNYKTPLTCDEACELEEFRMKKKLRNDWFGTQSDKGITLLMEKIEKDVCEKESRISFLENYRLKLHKKIPTLTTEKIEEISMLAFDNEDIRVVIEQFPYLTLDECKEWLKCYEELHKNKKKSFSQVINYTIKKENLEKLNKHRMLEEEQ